MDSTQYKIPDAIIASLFTKDKMKNGAKDLEIHLNSQLKDKNDQETIKNILEKFKTDLFDLNPEFKNNILRGDITPIISISEVILKYDPDPKLIFILFKPIFNLYKTLEPKQIINFTKTITNFLNSKTKLILSNFNDLFEVLILLKISQDQDVKNSGNLLDKILKDSLQKYSDNIDIYKDFFDFESFCNKINEKINLQQYIIINLLVNWIGTICQIRRERVVKFFQDILPYIFKLQMGYDKDMSKIADNCLERIKLNIEENFTRYYKYDKKAMEEILFIIIKEASPKSNKISIPAWELLNLYLEKTEKHLDEYLEREKKDSIVGKNTMIINSKAYNINDNDSDLKTSISNKENKAKSTVNLPGSLDNKIKINNSSSMSNIKSEYDKKNKKISKITNIKSPGGALIIFKNVSSKQIYKNEISQDNQFTDKDNILEYIPFNSFHKLLILITETDSQEIENNELINNLNDTLKRIIEKSPNEIKNYGFIPVDITNIILIGMKNPVNKNKKRFLEWCNILYKKYQRDIFKDFSVFIKEFIQAMPSNDINIFMQMVIFLSNIKIEGDISNIIMKNLTEKLMKEQELIKSESYVIIILEQLTKNSSLSIIYESFANALNDIKNFSFVSKMIHHLNEYLMRDPKAINFRKSLINNDNEEKYNDLFIKMYNIWSVNSISLLIFCVITEHFELAYNIILNLVNVQLDSDYYIHLAALVQLLESELYDYIRIRLLEPSSNIYLVRTLYGILMLLPQGQAFNVLSNRMSNVQTLFEIENGFENIKEKDNQEEIKKFIDIFLNAQKNKREDEENKNKNKLN